MSKEELLNQIILICKEAKEKNGHVRVFASLDGYENTVFRLMFDATLAVKPEDGVKEVTFTKKD